MKPKAWPGAGQARASSTNPASSRSTRATLFAAVHESEFGTSRTSRNVRLESAKWAKADIDQVAVPPKKILINLRTFGANDPRLHFPGWVDKFDLRLEPALDVVKLVNGGIGIHCYRQAEIAVRLNLR